MGAFALLGRSKWFRRALTRGTQVDDPRLASQVCGLHFRNPVGLAAGFDKNARWFEALATLGFGAIEIGSLTGQGQPGNPQPRLFRLPRDRAIINRMGFNNQGAEAAARNLAGRNVTEFRQRTVLGINLGKTKLVPNDQANDDYRASFRWLFPYADYFVLNVSSPNTPGLRQLQDREPLLSLLSSIHQLNRELADEHHTRPRPVLLKIAPDLSQDQILEIADIAQGPTVDGVIATNTTIERAGLRTPARTLEKIGAGGLSGTPLFSRSLAVVRLLSRTLQGKKPIIGVGGISNADQAWQMITAGASLVQLYTGLIYEGPFTVARINRGLLRRIDEHRYASIAEAVATDQ